MPEKDSHDFCIGLKVFLAEEEWLARSKAHVLLPVDPIELIPVLESLHFDSQFLSFDNFSKKFRLPLNFVFEHSEEHPEDVGVVVSSVLLLISSSGLG